MAHARPANAWRPAMGRLPRWEAVDITWQGRPVSLPYFHRSGMGGPSLLCVHGLGGAKENFYAAIQHPALTSCTVLAFDEPGTGLAAYQEGMEVSGLADCLHAVAERLMPEPFFLVGASMRGLISLLHVRRQGTGRILGFINLEGNLLAEDCMFSRRVIAHSLASLEATLCPQMIQELRSSRFPGDHLIADNMSINVDIRAYHAYSFETVRESDSNRLLEEFLALPSARLFLDAAANRHLSYLQRLRDGGVTVREVSRSGHFLFYDSPVETFQMIGDFVHSHPRGP
jgi:pimeloyl-ACP methyl ester carboxylesterase